MITTATLQVLLRILDFGDDALQAVDAPRVHHQLIPNNVWAEYDIDRELVRNLESKGHKVTLALPATYVTGVSAINRLSNGVMIGAGDYRKGGEASAF